jgi:hypothetical protein
LPPNFGLGIPEVRAIDPFASTDWTVTGVEPDVKVKASDALDAAQQQLLSRARQ